MTQQTQNMSDVSFHEATLLGIAQRSDSIELNLDGVLIAGFRRPAKATIAGVRGIHRDGLPVGELHMEETDGEILTLQTQHGQTRLVVQWNDFAARRQHVAVYDLLGGYIALHAKAPRKARQT